MSKVLVAGGESQMLMELPKIGSKTQQPIPTLCYVIEQRDRQTISPTYHYQTKTWWTGKKSRLVRLLQKTKIMEHLGGLIFLLGIPLCLIGCVLLVLSYTSSPTEESSKVNMFSIMGPALMVLSFLSFLLGCLLDGQYKESRLPTIGHLHSTNHFRNDSNITKHVSHFEKQIGGSILQCNILPHPKQNISSVGRQNSNDNLTIISVKDANSDNSTPSDAVNATKSTKLKGILKKPTDRTTKFRSDKATKSVDFELGINQDLHDVQLKKDDSLPPEKPVTFVGPGRIIGVAGLLLWAVSEKIKLYDLSKRLQILSCQSKIKALRQVPTNI